MSVFQPRAGDVVRLRVRWAKQSRYKCAMCTRYMQLPECTSCGVSYEQISGDYFMVKAA